MKAETKRPPKHDTQDKTRLRLECECGVIQTLRVPADAPVQAAARVNGWAFHPKTGWVCPVCGEDVP